MSRIIHYVIRTIGGSADSQKSILNTLEKIPASERHDSVRTDNQISFPSTLWRGGIRDVALRDLSKRYPDVIIEVYGDGTMEDSTDLWKQRWHKGAYETCSFDPECLDEFAMILTPEEEFRQFSKYARRYYKLLDVIRDLAWRHILDTIERITGCRDAYIDIHEINEYQDILLISSLSNPEATMQVVEGVLPQEEEFWTDEGYYINYKDLSVEHLEKAVHYFDNLEKNIQNEKVTFTYHKEGNRYEFHPAQ